MSLSLVFQGISQLEDKYGEQRAKSIKAGIGSSLIFKGGDLDTNQEFAQVIGKRVITQRENFTSVVQQYNELDLLSSGQLRTLADNQAVYVSKHHQPTIVETVNFFNHSRYARLAKKEPAQCSEQSIQIEFDTKLRI